MEMDPQVDMKVAQASAGRKLSGNALLQAIEDVRALEKRCEAEADAGKKQVITDLILRRKRHLKGELEGQEKEADNYDKMSIPLAAFFFGLAAWLTATGRQLVPPANTMAVEACCYLLGAGFYVGCRIRFITLVKQARTALALLGKVE